MLKMGVIKPSSAAYASPVVMVKKPDGNTRVCIDYRKLNSVTIFDPKPMLTAEEIFAKLLLEIDSSASLISARDIGKSLFIRKTETSPHLSVIEVCSDLR